MTAQLLAIALMAFVFAWMEARRGNLSGAIGFFVIIFIVVAPLANYRYSPDRVNLAVFVSLFVAAMLLWHIYSVKRKGTK